MLRFTSFITEAAKKPSIKGGIGHMRHLADNVFRHVAAGAHKAISTLKGIKSGKTTLTRKIDDKGSLHFIRHPDGRVGIKYKGSGSHYNYTHEDIEKQHGHKPYLAKMLHAALDHAHKILPKKSGEYQGGYMSSPDERSISRGKISHQPNTIKYEAPVDSAEGQKLKKSKVSLVIHSELHGPDRKGRPLTNTSDFGEHPDVHRVDHLVSDDEKKIAPVHQKHIDHHIAAAEKLMHGHTYGHHKGHEQHMETYINSHVRAGSDERATVSGYRKHLSDWHDKQIASVKTPAAKARKTAEKDAAIAHVDKHQHAFQRSFDIHHHIQQAVNHTARGLDAASKQTFKTKVDDNDSGGEGHAATHGDDTNKIVDRSSTGFSASNFKFADRFKPKAKKQ